jgi:hypothetical protein
MNAEIDNHGVENRAPADMRRYILLVALVGAIFATAVAFPNRAAP